MKCYLIEMMTQGDYCMMMSGYYNYSCRTEKVVAKDKETAIKKAEYLYPHMVINDGYVRECEIPQDFYDQITIADLL